MKFSKEKIIETVDSVFIKGNYFYSEPAVTILKGEKSVELIQDVLEKSDKTPSEVVVIVLAAIRFVKRDINILQKLVEENKYNFFITENYNLLLEICIHRKVQSNIPERGFPILEILGEKIHENKIAIIELGASYGLIGTCLLDPSFINLSKKKYLESKQQ